MTPPTNNMKKLIFFIISLLISTNYAHANSYLFIGAGPIAGDAYLVAGAPGQNAQ